jgi:hypothetical protein
MLQGVKYIDGGFSDNQPVLDANTITISPFSGGRVIVFIRAKTIFIESDICPTDNDSASILGFVYHSTLDL